VETSLNYSDSRSNITVGATIAATVMCVWRERERERENLFAKSNNETSNSKQHKIHWQAQAAREAYSVCMTCTL